MPSRHLGIQPPERRVRLRGGFLDEDRRRHEIARDAQPADRKILDRPHRLGAVVGAGGNANLAERIVFGPELVGHRRCAFPRSRRRAS